MDKKVVIFPLIGLILALGVLTIVFSNIKSSKVDLSNVKIEGVSDKFLEDMSKYFSLLYEDYRNGTHKTDRGGSQFCAGIYSSYFNPETKVKLSANEQFIAEKALYLYNIVGVTNDLKLYKKWLRAENGAKALIRKQKAQYKELTKEVNTFVKEHKIK